MLPCPSPGRCASTLLPAALVLAWGVGCVSGSLASSTGPRPPGHLWSTAPRQFVHVGETVRFDFVLQDGSRTFVRPLGLVDYVSALVGPERQEIEADAHGHFPFEHRFDGVLPGAPIVVQATAFQQRGLRDFIELNHRWIRTDEPSEMMDRPVADDRIEFVVYQTAIEMMIARPPDDLDPETGVLRIHRSDGTRTQVYIDRPHRPGFRVTGPESDGYYRVTYLPPGDQLNPVDTTGVEFTIYDVAGSPHQVTTTLETP